MSFLVGEKGASERDAALAIALLEIEPGISVVRVREVREAVRAAAREACEEPEKRDKSLARRLHARAQTIRNEFTSAKQLLVASQRAEESEDREGEARLLRRLLVRVPLEPWELESCLCGKAWPLNEETGCFERPRHDLSAPSIALDHAHHHCAECDLPAPASWIQGGFDGTGKRFGWWVALRDGLEHAVQGHHLVTAAVREDVLTGRRLFVGWACHAHGSVVYERGPRIEGIPLVRIEPSASEPPPSSVAFDENMPGEASIGAEQFQDYEAALIGALDKTRTRTYDGPEGDE
jgi:hypothetical protein